MKVEILLELEEVFEKVFDKKIKLSKELTAADIQGWDSLRHMLLIHAIEKKFDLKFSYKEVRTIKKLADILNLIEEKKKIY